MSKGSNDLLLGDKTSSNTSFTVTTATNFNNGISSSSGGTVTATTFSGTATNFNNGTSSSSGGTVTASTFANTGGNIITYSIPKTTYTGTVADLTSGQTNVYSTGAAGNSLNIATYQGNINLNPGSLTGGSGAGSGSVTIAGNLSVTGSISATVQPYLQASDSTDQQPGVTTPVLVTMNSTDSSSGITHSAGVVTILTAGVYFIMAAGQTGMTTNANINCHLWFRKNDVDIPDSNTKAYLTSTNDSIVLVCQNIITFAVNDTLKIYQSINVTGKGAGLIHTAPAGEPEIPSVIFSMFKIN